MTTFTPLPLEDGVAWGDADSQDPSDLLMVHYGVVSTGVTIYKDAAGTWHRLQYPSLGGSDSTSHVDGVLDEFIEDETGLQDAEHVFQGGHTYDITPALALELIAEGFGEGVNVAEVNGTWKSEELSKFSSTMILTDDPPNVATDLFVSDGGKLTVQLASGDAAGTTNLREWALHSDTAGWTDTHGIVEIDPPLFDRDVDGIPGFDILPQQGVVCRAQFNSSTGKNQGVTINNGTFVGLSILNIGAWEAFPDGTGFDNRQFSWPLFESLPLPYGWEWYLEANIIRVRIFPAGQSPETTPWDHPTHARILDLDVDCGLVADVPSPTGEGTNGFLYAHMGTDPRSAARIRRLFMERLL